MDDHKIYPSCSVSSGVPLDQNDDNDDVDGGDAQRSRTNYWQTLMHMLNGFIGSGILSMPVTFKNGGLILSSILNPMIGILSCYCIHMLISINQFAMSQQNCPEHQRRPYDYHILAEFAFNQHAKLRPWSKFAKGYVLSAIVAAQIGGCCVYFLFIATNLEKFLNGIMDRRVITKEASLALVLPVMMLLNCIPSLRKMSLMSIIANILQITGIIIIFYNLLSNPWPDFPDRLPAIGKRIPQFFVQSLFIFEGISLSMSLYQAIDEPSKFTRPTGVLNVGLLLITGFYFSLGFMGYARFGDQIEGSITINLPEEPLYDSVQIMYAIAVLFTYPLILYVPIQFLWPIVRRKFLDRKIRPGRIWIGEIIFRCSLVLLTYILATAIPILEQIISLVGSITSSTIAVIIPSALHLITFYGKPGRKKWWHLTRNLLIFSIGWLGFFFGSYDSLCDIIATYQSGNLDQDVPIPSTPLPSG